MTSIVINITNTRFKAKHRTEDKKEEEVITLKDSDDAMNIGKKATSNSNVQMWNAHRVTNPATSDTSAINELDPGRATN